MVNISEWSMCSKRAPKKKGFYTLLIGKLKMNWCEIDIRKSYWNGHIWDINDDDIPMKWKFTTPNDIEKFRC